MPKAAIQMTICTACPLYIEPGVKTICMPGKGNPNSGLFVIFDRPNRSEDSRSSSFSGEASKLFFTLMEKAGIFYPEDVFCLYQTKCYLPEEAAKELKETSKITCKATWLVKEILKYKPKIVVAVGAEVLTNLTEVVGVMKHRGSFIDAEIEDHKFKVMPTLSPAYLMQNHRELEGQVVTDLKRAYNAVHEGVSCWTPGKEKTLDYHYIKDMEMFREMMKEIRQAGKVACDIESRGKDPYFLQFAGEGFPIVSIQFSTHSGSGWFLLLSHETGSIWTPGEWNRIHKELRWLFESG